MLRFRPLVLLTACALVGCTLQGTPAPTASEGVSRHVTKPTGSPHPGLVEPLPFTPPPATPTPAPGATPGLEATPGASSTPTATPTATALDPGSSPTPGAPSATPTPQPTTAPTATPVPTATPFPAPLARATEDRPDDDGGFQIHPVYVVPSDATDRGLDTDGTLTRSLYGIDDWLMKETKKQRLHLDRSGGAIDISYLKLDIPDADVRRYGRQARDVLERELKNHGFTHPKKMYAVYYDGTNETVCGGAPWPPEIPGTVAALYLRGDIGCDETGWTKDGKVLTYREYAMIHEIFHGLGFVPRCAPHHANTGHTSSTWADLMYTGSEPWRPKVLDDMKELYNHGRPGCLDLAASAFLTPAAPGAEPPPLWDRAVSIVPDP